MIPAVKLKQNLKFNKNLGELIEVMRLAATLQFNQFRAYQEPTSEFLSSLESVLNLISTRQTENIFLKAHPHLPKAIILVSSDEGFLGELNALLVNKLMEIRHPQDKIVVLGRQGQEYLDELRVDFISFVLPGEKFEFKQVEALRDDIWPRYLKREIGAVHIVYARFVNIAFQQVESETLLPLLKIGDGSIFPISADADAKKIEPSPRFLIEPDLDLVFAGWAKLWLGFRFYQTLWSSKLAEFAARIMHLEASMQELNRVNRHLELEYFKYLHALSDKAIREISAARLMRRH